MGSKKNFSLLFSSFKLSKYVTFHYTLRPIYTTFINQSMAERSKTTIMKKNNQLLVLTHLSQLLDLFTLVGGFIVPLILWLTNKDKIYTMDAHGRSIINFRLSMIIYAIICIPLILLFGLGLLGFLVIGVFYFIFPIINAIKASNGEAPSYPFSLKIV